MTETAKRDPVVADISSAIASDISALARKHGYTVAVAESLTGGRLSSLLAAAPDSSHWYAGGLVCYETRIKYKVLGIPLGHPVITEDAVTTMVKGIARLMTADVAVAVSGAGGPGGQEGQPPGTTWIAALIRGTLRTELHHFSGTPEENLAYTEHHALSLLRSAMTEEVERPSLARR